jgi:predicted alpha/beta superfamily hydrolase
VRRADEATGPASAQSDAPPLLVLLDGNATFALAVSAARLQARLLGPVVIAAIAPANDALFDERQRFRDYTSIPSDTWGVPHDTSGHDVQTGGATDFESFIEGPLLEAVAARAPVSSTRRTLFGHSLGGFFVLHDLLNRPHVFSQYFAASPSIWWNDRELLKRLQVVREQTHAGSTPDAQAARVKLILRAGGDEQRIAPDATSARIERVRHAAMLDNLRAFEAGLREMPAAGIDAQLSLFPGQNHVSYLPAAISEAVEFAAGRRGVTPE